MWNIHQPGGFDLPSTMGIPTEGQQARFTGMTGAAESGGIYYALVNETMGGLFLLDTNEDYERRLLHRQDLALYDLTRCPEDGRLACSVRQADGAANIGLMERDGGHLREITGGDSIDEAPTWVPGNTRTLIFQSAGVGRNEYGGIFGLGPYGVQQLDLERDKMTTVLQLDAFDCLMPQLTAEGVLYYIRRPYQLRPAVSPWKFLGDVALFPFRLGRAVVHFLNAFSMMFSKKPLITAGGVRREGPDRRSLLLWGRWVQVDRQLGKTRSQGDTPLVPRDWKLMCRTPEGQEDPLAENVLAYDIAPDGTLLYTNGSAVYQREPTGKTTRLARGTLIERITTLV